MTLTESHFLALIGFASMLFPDIVLNFSRYCQILGRGTWEIRNDLVVPFTG